MLHELLGFENSFKGLLHNLKAAQQASISAVSIFMRRPFFYYVRPTIKQEAR